MIYVNSEGQLDFQVIDLHPIMSRSLLCDIHIPNWGRLGNWPFPRATISISGLNYRPFSGPQMSIYHISLENNLRRKPEVRWGASNNCKLCSHPSKHPQKSSVTSEARIRYAISVALFIQPRTHCHLSSYFMNYVATVVKSDGNRRTAGERAWQHSELDEFCAKHV